MKTINRIGLIAPFFPPEVGGACFYCFHLARELGEMGLDVHVFAPAGAQADPAYTLHPILTRHLATDFELLEAFTMDVWHSLYFFYAPLALHKRNVFVTGHGDDFFSYQLRLKMPLRRWVERHVSWRLPASTQASVRARMEPWELAYNRRFFGRAIDAAAQVIAVSSFSKARFCESFPRAFGKTTVIPPGVKDDFFVPRLTPLGRRRLLTVTRLDEADRIKNVHGVVQALGTLAGEFDFEYEIVSGSQHGRYREEIEELIALHSLQDRVRLLGRRPLPELIDLYRSADLFILVSYAQPDNFEGFGIVFLEANASGTPVLTSREGGMADYVREGGNGLYVDDPSAEAIARALRRFLSGDVRFSAEDIRRYPEPYRWTSIAHRVFAVYEQHAGV